MTNRGSHQDPKCLVMTFPAGDVLFRHVVTSELDRVARNNESLNRARRNLEPLFPRIDLYRQRTVLITDTSTEVWFAFRDGRGAVTHPATDMWWERPRTARAILHASGRLTGATSTFLVLFHIPRPVPSLVLARELMSVKLWAEVSRAILVLAASASLTSRMVVDLGTASPIELEFHVERDEVRPERYAFAVRTLHERDAASAARALRASSLAALDGKKRRALAQGATPRRMAQGQRLPGAVGGDSWAALVVCGIVRLYVATDALEPTVLYARDGSLLGTHLISVDESLAIGLQAVTPTVVLQFDPSQLGRVAQSDRRFARALASDGNLTLRILVQTYAMRSSADLGQRLANELLMISDLQEDVSFVPVTEQQLADGLGSIRESVARTLASFREKGLVATTRYGLMALDLEGLRALREGGPSGDGRGAAPPRSSGVDLSRHAATSAPTLASSVSRSTGSTTIPHG
jgi:CRP/FNR family transcriptional regulator, cyclic AMP receptor protein